jgi:uncharacterized protein YndB with AHSA1/START domain
MWQFEYSAECEAPRDFAWRFWTHVDNWKLDSDVDSVRLDGPFAAGSRGATKVRNGDSVDWYIVEVRAGSHAVIELPVTGAVLRMAWTFEDSAGGGTRITQQMRLAGEQAGAYEETIGRQMEEGMPQGMRKLAAEIVKASSWHG